MKKIIGVVTFLLLIVLAACDTVITSNARAVISNITPKTQSASFRVEVKDPSEELDNRNFKITLSSGEHTVSIDVEIAKSQIKLVEFTELNRETSYKISIIGTLNGSSYELYHSDETIKTLAIGDTEEDPISITTVEEFKEMEAKKHYKLMNDLDFENASIQPLFSAGTPFNGSFDGNGFTIKNINIKESADTYKPYLSIFGYASKSKITNLKLDNVHINNADRQYTGHHYVGLLVSKVSNNDFEISNIEILNSSVTISHNLNQTVTNRNLYVGLLGGSLQGKISNIVIKDSKLNVTQNSVNGTYGGSDVSTAGTYVGGVAGLIEQDKGKGISKLAVLDTEINLEVKQDKKSNGSGLYYAGSIFGAYRSDTSISEVVSNADLSFNYNTYPETEISNKDIIYIGGLIGHQSKANASDFYFFGNVDVLTDLPVRQLNVGLLSGYANKSSIRLLASGTLNVTTANGPQNLIIVSVYSYSWSQLYANVKVTNSTSIMVEGTPFDISKFEVVENINEFILSPFILNLIN